MEFSLKKCALLIQKSGKGQITEGIELPNLVKIRMLGEKVNFKYLGILQIIRDERKIKKSTSEK